VWLKGQVTPEGLPVYRHALCFGILTTIGFYASGHNLAMKNVAERIEKLPTGADDEEAESGVVEENILTASELGQVIDAAVDPYRIPICRLLHAVALGSVDDAVEPMMDGIGSSR
jgi:hypothetical protein